MSDSLDPMDCSLPDSPVLPWSFLKFMSIESVMLSNHLILCHILLLLPSIFLSTRVFFSESTLHHGQSIRASASVLPVNIKSWFPLGLTGLISYPQDSLLQHHNSIQKHQFFGPQPSSWSNSHIHTWLLAKSQLWLCGPCWQRNISAF